jgi:hypothetical protein
MRENWAEGVKNTVRIVTLGITLTLFLQGDDLDGNPLLIADSSLPERRYADLCDIEYSDLSIPHMYPPLGVIKLSLSSVSVTKDNGEVITFKNLNGLLGIECTNGAVHYELLIPELRSEPFLLNNEDIAQLSAEPNVISVFNINLSCPQEP